MPLLKTAVQNVVVREQPPWTCLTRCLESYRPKLLQPRKGMRIINTVLSAFRLGSRLSLLVNVERPIRDRVRQSDAGSHSAWYVSMGCSCRNRISKLSPAPSQDYCVTWPSSSRSPSVPGDVIIGGLENTRDLPLNPAV